jgi:hypothetical protein
MSSPPPPASPRGDFEWDPDRYDQKTETGWRWTPMLPAVGMRKSRGLRFGCIGALVLLASLLVIGFIAGGRSSSQPALRWTVDGQSTTSSTVGGKDTVQITVTSEGTVWFALAAAYNMVIYLNARDDWFKHHVITNPGDCTINMNLERLDCGQLAAGATKIIGIEGSPKDAGNFAFELDVADQEGAQLLYPARGSFTWKEIVTP